MTVLTHARSVVLISCLVGLRETRYTARPSVSRLTKTLFARKHKKTWLTKYGVDSPAKAESVRQKMVATTRERYGVDNIMQSQEYREQHNITSPFADKSVRDKIKATNVERYGVDKIGKSDIIRTKIESTCLSRHGAASPFESEDIRFKIAQTNIERYGVDNPLKYAEIRAKAAATTLVKYGAAIYTRSDEYKKQVETKRRKYVESLGLEYRDDLLIGPTKTEWGNIISNGLRLYFGAGITKRTKIVQS